jgi:hypothetical protein
MRQFLSENNMSLHVDEPELPELQRKFDIHIMDMILHANIFKDAEIRQLNYCRLYLGAVALSDLTHITRLRLDFSKLEGRPSIYSSVTQRNRIHQERPSDKDWLLWKKANSIWSDNNGKLMEALVGPWILHPKEQRQQHRAYYQKRGELDCGKTKLSGSKWGKQTLAATCFMTNGITENLLTPENGNSYQRICTQSKRGQD